VWRCADGRLKPTTKGITAELKHLPTLQKALARAAVTARELHLIATDDDGGDK
jgi:hypothetical protein